MDSLPHRFQVALRTLKRNLDTEVVQKMKMQVTGPQLFMLYYIRKHEKCKLTQLADFMCVKPSAITVMIDRLEKPGYVRRLNDPADRRAVLVEITEEGNELLQKALLAANETSRAYLSKLEPNEAALITELLEKMVAPLHP